MCLCLRRSLASRVANFGENLDGHIVHSSNQISGPFSAPSSSEGWSVCSSCYYSRVPATYTSSYQILVSLRRKENYLKRATLLHTSEKKFTYVLIEIFAGFIYAFESWRLELLKFKKYY